MSSIKLTDEIICAAEQGDEDALASVLEYFENDIKAQCLSCETPEIAASKREYIINCLLNDIKTEWPKIRIALEKALKKK